VVEGAELAGGKLGADLNVCGSIGRTVDGAQWIVRALRSEGQGSVALRVRRPPDDEGQELAISTPGKLAFMPAATLDGVGRMHVIWYEDGALLYARSETSDLAAGFAEPLVIDPQACPPPPWYPSATSSDGGRRLREYVDLTVAGARAHLSWTHAPGPPSRVHATYVAFAL